MINTLSLLRSFTRLSRPKLTLPIINPNLNAQNMRLTYNSYAFFSRSPKRNTNILGQLTIPTNKPSRNVKLETQGTSIKAMTDDKSISYKLGPEIYGATLGDTERYVIMCTCGVCSNKIVKTFTKKAYHTGVVIIHCDSCHNNHLIADNKKWFVSEPTNIEEIAEIKGDHVVKLYNDSKIQNVLDNLKFVGYKHTSTVESDMLGVPMESLMQVIDSKPTDVMRMDDTPRKIRDGRRR